MRRCDCGSDILIDIIYPTYCFAFPLCVYANLLIFELTLFSSLQMLCLSHILSLCLSASQLSFPPSSSHIKTHGNRFRSSFISIKSSDKHHCFTQRAKHNNNRGHHWKCITTYIANYVNLQQKTFVLMSKYVFLSFAEWLKH